MRFFKLENVVKRLQNRIHNTSWSLRGLGGGGGVLPAESWRGLFYNVLMPKTVEKNNDTVEPPSSSQKSKSRDNYRKEWEIIPY